MTFRRQITFTLIAGVFLAAPLPALVLFRDILTVRLSAVQQWWTVVCCEALFILGLAVLFFGGVMRIAGYCMYRSRLWSPEKPKEGKYNLVDCWICHVDREGNDLDARN
jgi:hypothetical protein